MNYYISDEVPNGWNHIVSAFIASVEHSNNFGHTAKIEDLEFIRKRGYLQIGYKGGDTIIDGYALFARILSSETCTDCGVPATRQVFESPKCDNCY